MIRCLSFYFFAITYFGHALMPLLRFASGQLSMHAGGAPLKSDAQCRARGVRGDLGRAVYAHANIPDAAMRAQRLFRHFSPAIFAADCHAFLFHFHYFRFATFFRFFFR
jgi:hypothetical protein